MQLNFFIIIWCLFGCSHFVLISLYEFTCGNQILIATSSDSYLRIFWFLDMIMFQFLHAANTTTLPLNSVSHVRWHESVYNLSSASFQELCYAVTISTINFIIGLLWTKLERSVRTFCGQYQKLSWFCRVIWPVLDYQEKDEQRRLLGIIINRLVQFITQCHHKLLKHSSIATLHDMCFS